MSLQAPPTAAVTLPATGVFQEVSERARALFTAAGKFESLAHGAYLATQGEPHHTLSVIISGTMNVFVHAHADILQVATIKSGETVGEMNLLDPVDRASADVVVAEPSVVFTIGQTAFQDMVTRDPVIGLELVTALGRELCRRLRKTSETMLRQTEETRANFRDMDY
ncbi:MAG: cyclic nucleotide-binding domain-containing protein [Verrucomicrobiota bacterium]